MKTNHKNSHNREKGMITIILALTLIGVAMLALNQVSVMNKTAETLHKKNRIFFENQQAFFLISQQIKAAYKRAQVGCNLRNNIRLRVRGIDLCIDRTDRLCVSQLINSQDIRYCAAIRRSSLDWTNSNSRSNIVTLTSPQTSSGAGRVVNRIVVPNMTSSLRQDCNSPTNEYVCFRLGLCPLGRTNCRISEEIGSQVVRIGDLE